MRCNKLRMCIPPIWLWGVIVVFGAVARIWLWLHPVERLIAWTIADDAFYYFKIGENIFRGLGSTFDGLHPTNGYHPLWMLFTVVGFTLFPDRLAAVRALLFTEVVLDLGAGLTLAYLAFRLRRNLTYALIIAVLWMLNYRLIATTLNGMETALSLLLINLSLLSSLLLLERGTLRRWILFGLVSGLTILARTDNAILVGLLFVALLLTRADFRLLLLTAMLCALVNLPWLLWNYHHFHSLLQTSATAITFGIRRQLEASYGTPLPVTTLIVYWITLWLSTVKRLYLFTGLPFANWAFVSGLWLVGGLALLLRRTLLKDSVTDIAWRLRKREVSPTKWLWTVIGVWPIAFITAHVVGRWYFRPYYHASLAPSEVLLFGLFLHSLVDKNRWTRIWASLFIPLTLFAAFQFFGTNLLRHQEAMLTAASWLNDHSQECRIVGSFNAGILGFYYEKGAVVNLDGVVNNQAAQAIREGYLSIYVEQANICYLADFEKEPEGLLHLPRWGGALSVPITEAVRFPLPSGNGTYVIYHLGSSP